MKTLNLTISEETWQQFKLDCQMSIARVVPPSNEEAEETAKALMLDALTITPSRRNERDARLVNEAYEMALNSPAIRVRRDESISYTYAWIIEIPGRNSVQAKSATELLREVRAAKEYVEKRKGQDHPSIMIPVHGWIWHNFKREYTNRNKVKTDDALIEVVHDWACRAMQYYTRYNMEDPWTLVDAYEIALKCSDIQLKECDVNQGGQRTWSISTPYRPDVQAEGPKELYYKLREARGYCKTLKEEPRKHRTAREVIREAYAIAETCPAMIVEEIKIPGYGCSDPCRVVRFEDNDYVAEARGAEQLLREVKEAKDYYEAALKNRADAKCKAVKLDDDEEKHYIRHETEVEVVVGHGDVVRVDGLEQDTKELLLHFIDNLTIKEVSELLEKEYPCSVWDELHFIREKLRNSLELQGSGGR